MSKDGTNIRVEVETWSRAYSSGYEYYYINGGTFLFLLSHFIFNLLLLLFTGSTAYDISYENSKRYATVPIPSNSNSVTLTLSLKVGTFEVKSEPFKIVSLILYY